MTKKCQLVISTNSLTCILRLILLYMCMYISEWHFVSISQRRPHQKIYSHPSLIRTHVNPAGLNFLVPEPVHNLFACILYFLNRNPELVKAGQTCMLFGSQLTKIHLVLLCYIGKYYNIIFK